MQKNNSSSISLLHQHHINPEELNLFFHADTINNYTPIEKLVPNSIRQKGYVTPQNIDTISKINPFELDPGIRNDLMVKEYYYNSLLAKEQKGITLSEAEQQRRDNLKEDVTKAVEKLQNWRNDPNKVMASRIIGTMVFGAFSYGWANMNGSKYMGGYEYDYDTGKVTWGDAGFEHDKIAGKPLARMLQGLAYGMDSLIARPLTVMTGSKDIAWFREPWVNAAGKGFTGFPKDANNVVDAEKLKEFGLDNNQLAVNDKGELVAGGRSAGHEWVGVTFDFANMTAMKYLTDIAFDLCDPHTKKPFIDDEEGFKLGEFGKWAWDKSWRGVVAVGQEWAAGVPYIFATKVISKTVDKFSDGFYEDTSPNANAGSPKVDKDGNIIGHYGIPGIAEFWARFDLYNQFTHRYRKTFDYIDSGGLAEDFHNWKESGYKLEPLKMISDHLKWELRETVKTSAFMAPAMPAYVMMRNPQRRFRAPVMQEVAVPDGEGGEKIIMRAILEPKEGGGYQYKNFTKFLMERDGLTEKEAQLKSYELWKEMPKETFEGLGALRIPLEMAWEGTGKLSYCLQDKLADIYEGQSWMGGTGGERRRWAEDQVEAALAYGPYLFVKENFIQKFDTPVWDNRLDSFLSPVYTVIDTIFGQKDKETSATDVIIDNSPEMQLNSIEHQGSLSKPKQLSII